MRLTLLILSLFVSSVLCAGDRIITVTDTAGYFPPAVGNGQLGRLLDISGLNPGALYSASLFAEATPQSVSTIIPAIDASRFTVMVNGKSVNNMNDWYQTLDMQQAKVITGYEIADGVTIEVTARALRQYPYMLLTQMRFSSDSDADVVVGMSPDFPDIYNDCVTDTLKLYTAGGNYQIRRDYGSYNEGKSAVVSASAVVTSDSWYPIDETWNIRLSARGTAELSVITAVCCSEDFSDPYNEAPREVLFALRQGDDILIADHERAWEELWKGEVEIDGDEEFAKIVNSSIYNLYSSLRGDSGKSIAPMGLTSDKYYGHIFWDADTWILPVMAILNPPMAKSIVDYRINRMGEAKRNAYARGYDGTMFPWESDVHGEESTPLFAMTGPLEHHITADVGIGAWIYYCATRDTAWLVEKGYPLIKECAEFVVSRVTTNGDGSKSIKNVVGADEYSIGVDDNAYTNGSAERLLRVAQAAAQIVRAVADSTWADIVDRMSYHYFPGTVIMRQHARYAGEKTKQADVELLAYPLNILQDTASIKANLEYYSHRLDTIDGPAMSHAAMAVNFIRMGQFDFARSLVEQAYRPHLRGPFYMLSETPGNDAIYFMTGAAALLQAVIFGYGGVDITPDGVYKNNVSVPAPLKSVNVRSPLWDSTH